MLNGTLGRLLALLCFLLLGAFGARDVLFPTAAWHQESRVIGEPLSGFWAFKPNIACYDDAAVYHFEADAVSLFERPKVENYPQTRIVILPDRRVRIDFPDDPSTSAVDTSLVLRDFGDRLEWEKTISDGVEKPFGPKDKPEDLVNCGTHSIGARLALLLRKPFDAGEYASEISTAS